ncbi:MAG: hydantoinase B/oxoprolinase family protein [Cyanobacteriota bacterium]
MSSSSSLANPIRLQVMANALAGIAEEMGACLIRGSYSANIKERRDCSTALFDAQGSCIAQAAHIPVHLGALSEAVRAVIAAGPQPGEVFLLNDPYQGGSHLPDLTVVTAIPALEETTVVSAYAVNRAHHADVGGMRPGSMPADSTEIWQEGLVIPPVRLARLQTSGALDWDEDLLRLILANVRNAEQRRGDLQAQVGANAIGVRRFRELLAQFGEAETWRLIAGVIDYSCQRMRAQIRALPDGVYEAADCLEGYGDPPEPIWIRVQIEVRGESLRVDFTGTDAASIGNLNAPLAVTRSAVLFALRCLLDPSAPSNAGVEAPIEIFAPQGCLVNAEFPAAVVAGNVETSQRIADVVLRALAPVAGSLSIAQGQGTMNNCVLGNRHFTYYETLGGGQGASPHRPGPDGIHVGMSNTLNTPIEALELEYPLQVIRYELRQDSGGHGRQRGGWGLTRSLRVLEDCTLSLLTDRRHHPPQGEAGGGSGQVGINLLNGDRLPSKTSRPLQAGDVITLHTPGGGAWGSIESVSDGDASGIPYSDSGGG